MQPSSRGSTRGVITALALAAVMVVGLVAVRSFVGSSPGRQTSNATSSTGPGSSTPTTTTLASSPSTISRVPDTESAYAAEVTTTSGPVTTSTGVNSTASNCPISGGSNMELEVVSDSTESPVAQSTLAVSAAFETGCNAADFHATDTLYFPNLQQGSSGWFILPSDLGRYNFTVGYAGQAFSFPAYGYPDSTTCVKLAVPSGAVTETAYQFSNYDCAGNLGSWAGESTHACFGEVYLRVLSDSGSGLVSGAAVTTTYDFATTCAAAQSCPYPSCTSGDAYTSFTTAGAEWYAFGDSSDSFSVIYHGQAYDMAESQSAATTCLTLHVPSGAVDTTYGTDCAGTGPSSSATISSAASTQTTPNTISSTNVQSTSSSSTGSSTGAIPSSISAAEVANVTLPSWPGEIAVDPVTDKAYISDLFASTLTVLNGSDNEVIRTISLPGTPRFGVAIDPGTDMVFVPVSGCTNLPNASNSCSSSGGGPLAGGIVRIDGGSDTIVGEFPLDVQRLAVDPTTQVLYGISTDYETSLNAEYLFSYDENTGAVLSYAGFNATILDAEASSQSNMVYMGACGKLSQACGNSEVLAFNETRHVLQWTRQLGYLALNFPLAFDPANELVFALGETGANLTLDAFNAFNGSTVYSVYLGSSCAGAGGGGMVVDTASNVLYVVSNGENYLLVIDAGTGNIVGTLSTPQSGGEYNIGLNQATHEVYLTSESYSHPDTGFLAVLSGEGLDQIHQVGSGLLQRGICLP